MAIDVATLLNDRINMRKIEWEDKFNETMLAFSDKVAKSISQKVFLKIGNSLNDSFKEMPTKEKPLQYAFSFEIVNPNTAKELKEMAGSASELAPFKEWFERFTVVGQKIARDGNDSFAISSSVISKMAPQGVREKGIDGLYFNEIMSLVGQTVERKLNALIKEETSKPENEELKITAVWVRRQEQLSSTASNLQDNSINVIAHVIDKHAREFVITAANQIASPLDNHRLQVKKQQSQNELMRNIVIVIGMLTAIYFILK